MASNEEKARQYGTAYATAMLKGDDAAAAVWFRRYQALPAGHTVRLAFEWAAEDRRAKG